MTKDAAIPKALIVLIAILGAIIFALFCRRVNYGRKFTDSTVVRAGRLQELRGDILKLDEVLTMSAYMASATADPKWSIRYRKYEPVLARAITEFKSLLPNAAAKACVELEVANEDLVALEYRALDLASKGKSKTALEILNSPAYSTNKAKYSERLNRLFLDIRESLKLQIEEESNRINISVYLATLSFSLLLFFLLCATRRFQAWKRAIAALIGQLREAESTIVAERNLLEVRVTQRTQELDGALEHLRRETEERAKAQERAEAANEAKSCYLAVMTHELKTPLNAVIGFAALLARGEFARDSEKMTRYVKNIESGGQHMRAIVGDLLDLAKIESGNVELIYDQVDVNGLVAEVVQLLHPLAEERSIQIEMELSADALFAEVDAARIRQILFNLMGNCLKFTSTGDTVSVTVEEHQLENRFQIVVSDHGPGLLDSDLEAVFEQHVQSGTAEQRRKGNGLGLPLSRELARLHGGDLWVESEGIGKGCKFICAIPVSSSCGLGSEPKAA